MVKGLLCLLLFLTASSFGEEPVHHTDLIGDTDSPTIDGGIINAADGLPVTSKETTQENTSKISWQNLESISEDENREQKSSTKIEGKNAGRFQDDWATSDQVAILLKQAARDGKLDYVLKKADEKGLPASVATIPMVESNYHDDAISNKGAVGSWQLMPKTAQELGLKPEERKQFTLATDAALNMLNDLHQQFGSWELAFAAYNAGPARVQAALKKNPSATSVQELDLPQETKDYVKQIALINKKLGQLS
jgi:membrane-bound lytic murein transglycosylase MltF